MIWRNIFSGIMTRQAGQHSIKYCPCVSNHLRDIKIYIILENGRFDLENVGQGQLAIHHFS